MLLEVFAKQVDAKNLPAYVEGTPMGVGMYRKFFFEEVDDLRLELEPWKEGDYFNICMVRPAKVSS
jgi:hypothetical protein